MRDVYLNRLLAAAIGTRALIFLIAIIAPLYLAQGPAFNNLHENTFLNAFAQYDAAAYLDIAEHGYNSEFMDSGNYQWWPLLPMCIAFLAILMHPVLAGFLIANIAFFLSIFYLYKLLKDDIGQDTAYFTTLLLVLYPTSYFLSSIYSESLYLFTTVAAIYYAKQSRWGLACTFGALSALTRIFGVFIILPLGYLYLKERGVFDRRSWTFDTRVWYLLFIPLAVLLFMGQMYTITGNPIKFTDHSQTSNRHMAPPFYLVYDEIRMFMDANLFYKGYHTYNLFIYLSFVLAAALSVAVLAPEYAMVLVYSIAIPTISTPIQGFARYSLVMFPAFMVLHHYQKKKLVRNCTRIWMILSILLLAFFTAWHVRGGFA